MNWDWQMSPFWYWMLLFCLSNAVVIMGSGSLLVLTTDGDGYLREYELFLCLYASWTFD